MALKRLACGLTSIGILATGCTALPAPPQTLVIGILTASEEGSALSEQAEQGAQLAIEIVNDAHPDIPVPLAPELGLPRLNGSKLKLVSRNTTGKAELASAQAAELVADKHATALVVAGPAEVAASAASEAQRLRVPLIDAYNTDDYLTELGIEWYFRAAPMDRLLAEDAFSLLRSYPAASPPSIAIVTEAGTQTTHLKEVAARSGSKVLLQHEISPKATDTDALSSRLTATPSAIYAWAHTAGGAEAISRAAAGVPGSPPLIGLGPGFRTAAKPAAAQVVMRAVPWSAELAQRSPAAKAVMELYEKRFGQPMGEVAAASFTAAITLAAGINAAGSGDPSAIRSALRQTSLPPTQMIMPWNGLLFGPDGQNQLAGAVIEAWAGKSFRVVYPAEVASGPVPWGKS
ncbi:ABC transporter substrate-binding protein [Catelliglobosispora koreensis]|uniref:ABC transporter substrate-binding protein n=1 Tax=Catelliglobosispora koreensis TaxID=129052 RepID=UPI00035C4DDA|nr:ABC transporter substrate-binding protein [Catelliglobosispora koreensis]